MLIQIRLVHRIALFTQQLPEQGKREAQEVLQVAHPKARGKAAGGAKVRAKTAGGEARPRLREEALKERRRLAQEEVRESRRDPARRQRGERKGKARLLPQQGGEGGAAGGARGAHCLRAAAVSGRAGVDSFSGLKSASFQKDAHVHRAARKSMAAVLEADNYDSLRMDRIDKTQLRQLHDQIDERLTRFTPPKRARD